MYTSQTGIQNFMFKQKIIIITIFQLIILCILISRHSNGQFPFSSYNFLTYYLCLNQSNIAQIKSTVKCTLNANHNRLTTLTHSLKEP